MINSRIGSRPAAGVRRIAVPGLLLFILLCLSLAAAVAQPIVPQATHTTGTVVVSSQALCIPGEMGPRVVPDLARDGQVLVRLRSGATDQDIADLLDQTGAELLRRYAARHLLLLKLPPGVRVVDACREYMALPQVELAEPDRLMYALRVPNDWYYGTQWHLPKISAPAAWDTQTGSTNQVVAVVDSGIDLDHPDLLNRIWQNAAETPGDAVDNDNNGYVDDIFGWDFLDGDNDPSATPVDGASNTYVSHGTHVAGIIGATTNNTEGIAGVDWNCRIMPLRCMDPELGTVDSSDGMDAVDYAVANGATVICLSFQGAYSDVWTDTIANAVGSGVVVVAAAGDAGEVYTDQVSSWRSPICNDGPNYSDNNVIGVGATDSYDRVWEWWFSEGSAVDQSSRSFIDVMAPGQNIWSCAVYEPAVAGFSSYYRSYSGCSMACGVVAGVASLVRAQFPQFTPASVVNQIRSAADNIDSVNSEYVGSIGAGRVNADKALDDIPPALPRSIMAYDTPNDSGGSMTVAWSKSTDDGRGANDVVGYTVQRSDTGEAGSFATLPGGTVPAGTTNFVDTLVTDYRDYYYRVGVRDGSNIVFTNSVGPVQARDDTPPDALAPGQLIAADIQGDTGGAIGLSWSTYVPPADFGAYRIWRATTPFTNVEGMGAPLAVITNANTKSYVDADNPATEEEEVVDGVEYYYAVTVQDIKRHPDWEPNEILDVAVAGPVVASPNFTVSYPPGLKMIAIGAQPHNRNMGAIFGAANPGDLKLARWDPEANGGQGAYVVYADSPNAAFLEQRLGRGFWYSSTTGTVLNISGMPPPAGNYLINVVPGWNQLGNPYGVATPVAGSRITVFNNEMSLAEANAIGYARDYFWRFDPYTNSYKLISEYMTFAEQEIPKDQGFYFRSFEPGVLQLPRPAGVASVDFSKTVKPVVDDNHWTLRLVASCGQMSDTDNFIGVNPDAAQLSGVASPPMVDGSVDLSVADESGNRVATSFVKAVNGSQTWELSVLTAAAGQPVVLSWPDLSQVPARYRIKLVDTATGRTINMRTATAYSYDPAGDGAARKFEVTIGEQTTAALTITGLQTMATNAGGVQVSFALSQDASVDVEVLNISGRRVRSLASGSAFDAGAATLAWDKRADTGTRVPPGRYLVCVEARSEDGTVARAIGTLQIGN